MIALINIIRNIPLFASLTEANRENLANLLRRKSLEKHEILFREGDEGTVFYIILQGRIKISVSRKLENVTLAILGPGEFLGEMALLDGLPRSADATAIEKSQLYALSRKDFLSFLVSNENAVRGILYSLSTRLRKTDNQLAEMCFLNLSARLAKKLVEMAMTQSSDEKQPQPCSLVISQQELGNILGVSRESINKELRILRDKGCVTTSRNKIVITDLECLMRRMP